MKFFVNVSFILISVVMMFSFNLYAQENQLTEREKEILEEYESWSSMRDDWANLNRYREQNQALGLPDKDERRVVLIGNSITEGWSNVYPDFFEGKPYINRGISGQTTPQMMIRFRQDVVDLKPEVVVILAGTNDIAGNTGPSTPEMIADNIFSMAEIANANGIKVILGSILPACEYPWRPAIEPAAIIREVNGMLKRYAKEHSHFYLNYHTEMSDGRGGMKPGLAYDGVHPTSEGYRVMSQMAEKAINEVLDSE